MNKRIVTRLCASLSAVCVLLGLLIPCGSLYVAAAESHPAQEWVIYRPGTDTALIADEGSLQADDAGATISLVAGERLEFSTADINLEIPDTLEMEDLALHMRIYLDSTSMMNLGQIELSNTGRDTCEVAWLLESISFVSGWNDLVLPLSSITTVTGEAFDLYQPIRWFRLYTETASRVNCTVMVENVSLTLTESGMTFGKTDSYVQLTQLLPQAPNTVEASIKMEAPASEWVLSTCDGKDGLYNGYDTVTLTPDTMEDGTPYMRLDAPQGSKVSLRNKNLAITIPKAYERENLALSFKVYVSDVDSMPSSELEVTSDTNDSMEISWKVAQLGWHSGWNEVLLPFTTAHHESSNAFDCHYINFFRWTFSGTMSTDMVLGVAELKIVPLKEEGGETGEDAPDGSLLCDASTHMIFSNTNSGDPHPFALLITGEGHPSIIWDDRQVTFGAYVFTGEWLHLAVVRDMAQQAFILYIDGEEAERADAGGTRELTPTTLYCIGSDGAGIDGGTFGGTLGDIRVWSRVRSAEQIAAHLVDMTCSRESGLAPNEPYLMGAWFLRGNLSNIFETVPDGSQYGNTGVVCGSRANDWVDYQLPDFCQNGDYYSVVLLPDIQELTAKYPDVWYTMAQWIRDNAEAENIQHVISLGDSTYNNNDREWSAARAGYDMFSDVVTYTNILGNHDYGDWSKPWRDTTMYNTYFPYTDAVANNASFVAAYKEGEMDNAYYTFTAGDIPYLVLQLEYRPRDSILEWANAVLDAYPHHNVIIAVHGYLNSKGQVMTDEIEGHQGEYIFTEADNGDPHNNAQELWDEVIATHDNVRLVLCGHKHSEDVVWRCDYTNNGTPVYQMLFCAQDMDAGYFEDTGVGMMTILRFSADGTRMAVNYYAPVYDKSFREINQFTVSLDVLDGGYESEPEPVAPAVACTHEKTKWITDAATCIEPGQRTLVCAACGKALDSEEIPALGHTAGEWTVTQEPTCAAAGRQERRCTVCGELLESEELPMLEEHTFEEWTVDKEPTFEEAGHRWRVCSVCGEREEETLDPLTRLPGDVDGNGVVDSVDARLVLQYAARRLTLDDQALAVADVNGDGAVDTTDARLLLQTAAKRIALTEQDNSQPDEEKG